MLIAGDRVWGPVCSENLMWSALTVASPLPFINCLWVKITVASCLGLFSHSYLEKKKKKKVALIQVIYYNFCQVTSIYHFKLPHELLFFLAVSPGVLIGSMGIFHLWWLGGLHSLAF